MWEIQILQLSLESVIKSWHADKLLRFPVQKLTACESISGMGAETLLKSDNGGFFF